MRFDSRVGVLFARAARGKEGRSGGKAAALRGGVLAKQQVDAQQAGACRKSAGEGRLAGEAVEAACAALGVSESGTCCLTVCCRPNGLLAYAVPGRIFLLAGKRFGLRRERP